MTSLVLSVVATFFAAAICALVVVGFEQLTWAPDYVSMQPLPPLAAAAAMAAFAVAVGALSIATCAALARWLPVGLAAYGLVVVGTALWLSPLALTTKPVEAPMYLVLHAVFAVAFGVVVPLVWYLR